MRRGPTIRGGRHRTGVGKSVRVPLRRSSVDNNNMDEEERMGLTADSSSDFIEENEKTTYDIDIDNGSRRISEKLETDEHGMPLYHHGEETFGDILTHPVQELHAHQHRKEEFKSKIGSWSRQGRKKGVAA